MDLVDQAMRLALLAHHGQTNKHDGEPYVLHLHRVAISCRRKYGVFVEAIAWLHDIVEDTDTTLLDLHNYFDPADAKLIVPAVDTLTKRNGETNEQYYIRCKSNDMATLVKIADIHDNFGRNHLIEDEETRLRMAKKYSLGLDILVRNN